MLTPASHLTSIGLQQPSSSGDESNFCDESGETSEKKLDMKSMGRECLKVFDFDMSGDEDDVSEGERDLKRTRVDQGIPCKPAASGKQSLLPQYARGANVRSSSQCAGSDAKRVHQKISNPKAARDGKPIKGTVTVSARKKAPASTNGRKSSSEYDIRSTISKLLASKAEGLRAAVGVTQRKLADQEAPSEATTIKSVTDVATKEDEPDLELVNRRVKRKISLSTAAAAKKVPPKRARLEKKNFASGIDLGDKVYSSTVNSLSEGNDCVPVWSENLQAKESGIKRNGIKSGGTLEKSEIATRTRASRRDLGRGWRNLKSDKDIDERDSPVVLHVHGTALSDSSHASAVENDYLASPLSQDTDADMTESPVSSVSSHSQTNQAGWPSPRYTARGRRKSDMSPTLKKSSLESPLSGHVSNASATEQGTSVSRSQKLPAVKVKPSSTSDVAPRGRSDPYSFDSDQGGGNLDKTHFKKYLIQPVSIQCTCMRM